MIGITKKQAMVLDIIERGRVPPTLREIGSALSIRSTNAVNDHILALERKGRIEQRSLSCKTRQLRVTVPLTTEERMFHELGVLHRCEACGHIIESPGELARTG